jgi:hypothetical protein
VSETSGGLDGGGHWFELERPASRARTCIDEWRLLSERKFEAGPGVNKKTLVSGTGTETWMVTLKPGKYTYPMRHPRRNRHERQLQGNAVTPLRHAHEHANLGCGGL